VPSAGFNARRDHNVQNVWPERPHRFLSNETVTRSTETDNISDHAQRGSITVLNRQGVTVISIRRAAIVAAAGALAFASVSACGSDEPGSTSDETVAYPTSAIELMAPASPGGGWDGTARAMQQVIQDADLTTEAVEVVNVPGAAGTLGLAELVTKSSGDAHHLMVTGLVMVGGVVTNKSMFSLEDTTPIATLTAEAEVLVVPADSPYATLEELMTAWKADPGGVKVGGGSAGGTDQILAGLLAESAGIDPRETTYVPYSGGGEAKAALLSGDLGVAISGVSEFRDLIEAGELRALGVSGAEPFTIASGEIPTLADGGYDVELMNWRGVVAPPGISDAERRAITEFIDKLHASAQWQEALETHGWDDFYKSGDEAVAFYQSETERITGVLTALGLAGS
jgi:putative tricarboxylic transport membrane protein